MIFNIDLSLPDLIFVFKMMVIALKLVLVLFYVLTLVVLLKSDYMAWGFELSDCLVLPNCQGTGGDAQLEGAVRK